MADRQKMIITLMLCITFLFTGWTAGSSFGFKRGFAEAERQSTITRLDTSKEISPETEILVRAAARARAELLIRYKNIPDRDFATILAAHQKTAALLCIDYQEFSTSDYLKNICDETVIPSVKKIRNAVDAYLVRNGLN
ncbi:MAG: hypothetical protein ACJARD_000759 [Alphaproteobacteria bacterium]|jgi:hypothetical protein